MTDWMNGLGEKAHRAAGGEGENHIRHVLHRLEFRVGGDGQLFGAVFQL